MANRDLSLSVLLKLVDSMSGPAAKALSTLTGETAKAHRAQRDEYQRMTQARELLGVRSERTIRREIQQTEAAYRRLASSGTMGWREQARAAEAMRAKVSALNAEMGKLSKTDLMRGGLAGIAGAAAAGAVLKPKAEQAMSYDLRLAYMANTAFTDRDTAGRKAGMKDLDAAINRAIRAGGGTRDQAAETLDALIASGAMTVGDATGLLPTLMKSSTASGAEATQLANIAIRGMQTFKIKPGELPSIIDMAIAAGQAGGFELKDMAKWLPSQMAAASATGLSGTSGFAKLAALNQAAVITAGTKDEAGNNLVNLLAKINSADTAKDAEKLGINLPQYLAKQRMQGTDSVDAFVGLVDSQVSKLTAWKQLQQQLKDAKGDADRRATLESMANIVQGSGMGGLIQDRQAMMALVAIMNNRNYLADVQKKTLGGAGATAGNFALIEGTASFHSQRAANAQLIAQQSVMESTLMPAIKTLAGGFADISEKYPALTTATVAATTALTALAAAAGAAGLTNVLTGGGAGGTGRAVLGGAKRMLAASGGFALKRALPLYGAWEAGQLAGDGINWGINKTLSWGTGKETSLGSLIYDKTHSEPARVGGEIRVRVDQDGRVSGVTARSNNRDVPFAVEGGGQMMVMP
jgi:hypothetical protein